MQPLSVVHVGGDEVNASTLSCSGDVEQLKQNLIGGVARRAAGLGLAVQAWDDALAAKYRVPVDARRWTGDRNAIFINAWNNNRRSNAFSYANSRYKVRFSRPALQ